MPWSQAAAIISRAAPRPTWLPKVTQAPKDSAESCRPEDPRRRYCMRWLRVWSEPWYAIALRRPREAAGAGRGAPAELAARRPVPSARLAGPGVRVGVAAA